MDNDQLYSFIVKAFRSTYATSGVESVQFEKDGFKVLNYGEGEYSYKDSYTGFFRSRGMIIVNFKNQPVWTCAYGGGMVEENTDLAFKTFDFLKKAFLTDEQGFQTFRGPHKYTSDNWDYKYNQEGDVKELTNCLIGLINNPNLRFKLAQKARLRAETEFNAKKQSQKIAVVYQKIMSF